MNLEPRAAWLLAELLADHLEHKHDEAIDHFLFVPRADQIVVAAQLHDSLSESSACGGYPSPWTKKEIGALVKENEPQGEFNLTQKLRRQRKKEKRNES